MSGPCPACGAPVEAGDGGAMGCPSCGVRFHAANLAVESLTSTKIAGVRRHRYRLKATGIADVVLFEGPQGLALAAGDAVVLLTRDGRPAALWRASEVIALAPSASDEGAAIAAGGFLSGSTGAIVWAIAFVLVIAAAACLDLMR
ncbi:MAG: hypothetical protein U0166_21295 [Acidobacteriota bacterium]